MAEFLVMAVERTHPDAEKDRTGIHKKGDIVVVKEDGHAWGAGEGLPTFVVVRCPGLALATVEDRMQPWRWNIALQIDQSNLASDVFRVTATNTTQAPSGQGALTLARVQTFLERWNLAYVSSTATSVTFDADIYAMATSVGFWDTVLTEVLFTQTAYVQQGGVHTIELNYSAHPRFLSRPATFERAVAARIEERGGTVLSNAQGIAIFSIARATVREAFRTELTDRLGVFRRHRYYFTPAQVDTVIGLGGAITVTMQQLTNAVRDRTTE